MLWVRSEYADPLAIAFAWLAVLLPWNVTYAPNVGGGTLVFVRFPFVQIRFANDVQLADPLLIHDPLSAIAFQDGTPIQLAYQAWAIGAVAVGLAIVLSVVIFVNDTPSVEQRVDPIRLMGALLGVAAVILTAASYLLYARGFNGPSFPVGVVLLYAFSLVLLFVERIEPDPATAAA